MTTRRGCPYCGTPGTGEPCDPHCPPSQPPSPTARTDTRTPGQIAYDAYERTYTEVYRQWLQRTPGEDHYGDAEAYAWHRQATGVRTAWEAAAQAVLAQCTPQVDVLPQLKQGDSLHRPSTPRGGSDAY